MAKILLKVLFLLPIFFALPAGSACVNPSGIIGWWKGETNALDTWGNNDGVLYDEVTFTNGIVGQAFHFSGDHTVYIPYSTNLNTASFSLEAWVLAETAPPAPNPDGPPSGYPINFIFGFSYNPGFLGIVNTGSRIAASLRFDPLGGGYEVISSNAVPIGQFIHLVGTYDDQSQAMKIYVNGVLQGEGTLYMERPDPFGALFIGPSFQGTIDEATYYNRPLSASEVAALYNAGSDGKRLPAPAVINEPPTCLADGSVVLNFTGIPGVSYRIQYADSLIDPVWHDLDVRRANTAGVVQITDLTSIGASARFYRIVWP